MAKRLVGSFPRIGLYCDLRNPSPGMPWSRVYGRTLDRVVEAERRGLDAVWVTEHHGFADGYLPQPLTFCAALAARTTRVRIGTAVVIAPLLHPHALAEQAAVVDILSAGRLELGLGAGYREDEFTAFGADRAQRFTTLETVAAELPALWADGRVTPPPVQSPLPLWIGGRGPRGARIAGRLGAGFLWIDRELWPAYHDALTGAGHDPATARVGGLVNLFLADDPEAVMAQVREQGRRNRESYRSGTGGTEDRGAGGAPTREPPAAPLLRLQVLTPADAAAHIAETIAGLPVTDVFCFERIGALDEALVDRHVELLTGELPAALRTLCGGPPPGPGALSDPPR